jgi:hypothetical protein
MNVGSHRKVAAFTCAAATLILTVGASASAGAAGKPANASVTGSAQVFYTYSPDDDIRFSFDARSAPFSRPDAEAPEGTPTDARGTVKFSHWVAALNRTYLVEAEVDCLLTGGPSATLTAIVTTTSDGQMEKGTRLGFSVYDAGGKDRAGHGRDRMGFSWGKADGRDLRKCMAPAPFNAVTRGGYSVKHAELLPPRG